MGIATEGSCLLRKMVSALIALCCMHISTSCIQAAPLKAGVVQRAFNVRASIEMPRVLVSTDVQPGVSWAALFSPDQRLFVVRTRYGNVRTNQNFDSLKAFRTAEVVSYICGRSKILPKPKTVFVDRFTYDAGELSHVKWLDESHVAFIAQATGGKAQIFTVNVHTGTAVQVTRSRTSVTAFDEARGVFVYYAREPLPNSAQVQTIDKQPMFQLLSWDDDPESTPVDMYLTRIGDRSSTRVDMPSMRLIPYYQQIWMSPSGKFAVTLVPATTPPDHWSLYKLGPNSFGRQSRRSDPTSWDLVQTNRYELVNLEARSATPLLDAPSGVLALNGTPQRVFWSADSRWLVVTNTFLPLAVESNVNDLRSSFPAIAEVGVPRGPVSPILFEPNANVGGKNDATRLRHIASVEWLGQGELLVQYREGSSSNRSLTFRRTKSGWRASAEPANSPSVVVTVRQGLNERPRLFAAVASCNSSKEIFDPAPNANSYTFGRAEAIQWTDRNGILWRGGLIEPPNFHRGMRFPLVVQTHGFSDKEFLTDGPDNITTGMAAQALANVGFLVLQVPDSQIADTPDEARLYAEGYRAGIGTLISKGLVEPEKVGLVAFSRTGLPSVELLAESPKLLRAAVLADAGWWGYLLDLELTNYAPTAIWQYRRVTGGSLKPADRFVRDPLYRLPEAETAIRLETHGVNSFLTDWEQFALLKNSNHPVDFVYLPQARHVAMKPAERMASQGGAVDWFRFWLQGYEDHGPAKAKQYRRWEKLCDLQIEQVGKAHTFCVPSQRSVTPAVGSIARTSDGTSSR